ncbi:RNA methyltransferase [Geoalkalibacter halelectricus]|uniref:tRNA (cytidine/uridine-2'-O-)-methyltransferase TrmJ n=1 Tax=Geoalkalibacter halelectricus TaxID=2847045 RepID=A0ABY5ZNK5_9BACT|nr:RNA methyltransferase [Geoalkalibacter halelectricus]MDO3377510.1 RNA methyltransferase [Geoalkalibacter halelectricus]UWZ80730.1 RNA methyltransferase [Geoalkalibacter halelectricus]
MSVSRISERLAVILVEPRHPGNIGMVCRAMANFGVRDLRLVNPCAHLHPEAHKFAVFASELLGEARVFATLADALADLEVSVATTRRPGRLRAELLDLAQIPRQLETHALSGRIGLVFGREDAGLTNAEVAACRYAATIATQAHTGSLNLAQAVVVSLYELCRAAPPATGEDVRASATEGELAGLYAEMEAVLRRIAFLNPACPEAQMNPLRDIFRRAGLTSAETGMLRGLWSQLAWSIRDWRGPRKGGGGADEPA